MNTKVTELDILVAARDAIKKGYTNSGYIQHRVDDGNDDFYYDEVVAGSELKGLLANNPREVAVCAIGGVEHALFALTGKFVDDDMRGRFAYVGAVDPENAGSDTFLRAEEARKATRAETSRLYIAALDRLNRIAVKLGYSGGIEQPNLDYSAEDSKPIVLDIYRRAIRQARDEQRRTARTKELVGA